MGINKIKSMKLQKEKRGDRGKQKKLIKIKIQREIVRKYIKLGMDVR